MRLAFHGQPYGRKHSADEFLACLVSSQDYRSYFTARWLRRTLRFMVFNALCMCRDQRSLRVLRPALDEVGIQAELRSSAADAVDALAKAHYSALLLDFDLMDATIVARAGRLRPADRRPVAFAMIGALTEMAATFRAGANFVLYKPLKSDQITRSLRAGRVFMQPERRRSRRRKLETLVYLQFGIAALPAIVLNLNRDGLSLQASEPLPPVQHVPLRFVLPGTTHIIEGDGEVTWADDNGRAGMLFKKLSTASRRCLEQWLAKHSGTMKVTPAPLSRQRSGRAASAAY
jgi:CheY-like chemotaxis protein